MNGLKSVLLLVVISFLGFLVFCSQAVEVTNSIGMKFRLIPAGEFWMGAVPGDDEANDDESPRHRVEITKPFYLGVYEVTQEQWQRVMGTTVRQQRDKVDKSWTMRGEGSSYPIYYVSWGEAVAFCEKLNHREDGNYRLPTEAEWEYACRAGAPTKYYWGDSNSESVMKQYAWYEKNADDWYWTSPHAAREGTQPVGQKLPNAWGLYDMSGNVWEWCSDWYDKGYYNRSPSVDPRGPSSGDLRVLRGGSWLIVPRVLRSSFRLRYTPVPRDGNIGFRILRDVK